MQTYLTTKQTANLLQVSENTLRYWRMMKKGPNYIQFEGTCRYLPEEIDAWVEKNRVILDKSTKRSKPKATATAQERSELGEDCQP